MAPTKPAAPAGQATSPVAKTLKPFKIAIVFPGFGTSNEYMAQKQKFFEESGLQAEIVVIPGDTLTLKALLAGEIDAMQNAVTSSLAAAEEGAGIKICGGWWPKLNIFLFSKQELTQFGDIVGRSVAIAGQGDASQVMTQAALKELKLDPNQVTYVAAGAPGVMPALVNGTVDAAPLPADNAPAVLRNQGLKILGVYKDILPRYFFSGMVTTDKMIKDKLPDLISFATASVKGLRYTLDHREETADLIVDFAKREKADVLWAWDWYTKNEIYSADFYVAPDSIMYMQEINQMIGSQKRTLPIEQIATWDIQQAVVKNLGPYRPANAAPKS